MSEVVKEVIDLGQLLLDYHLIKDEQLKNAQEESRKQNKDIREMLVELRYVNEGAINYVLSSYLDLPYVHISPQMVDAETVRSIPSEILRRYRMVPVIRVADELNLVMADPTDTAAIHEAEIITGCSIKVSIGLTDEILEVIDHLFKKEVTEIQKPSAEIIVDTTGVVFVYQYLTEALDEGATHIYIEPTGTQIRVGYRMADGTLTEKKPQPLSLYPAVCSRLKIMANMSPEREGLYQERNLLTRIGNKEIYLHITVLPSVHGDCWTIKIVNKGMSCPKLEELGLPNELLPQIRKVLNQPSGVIIITGTGNSGRTTTAYSLLSEIDAQKKKVATMERVVSYQNEGFVQIESAQQTILEAVIRETADVVMVEDMNPEEVLKCCFNAALAGKLILGQMSHPDTFDLLAHLIRTGLGPPLLAETLLMVINQSDSSIYEILLLNEKIKNLLRQEEGLKKVEEEACQNGFYRLKEKVKEVV